MILFPFRVAADNNTTLPLSSGRHTSSGFRAHRGLGKALVVRTRILLLRAALRDRVGPAKGTARMDVGREPCHTVGCLACGTRRLEKEYHHVYPLYSMSLSDTLQGQFNLALSHKSTVHHVSTCSSEA